MFYTGKVYDLGGQVLAASSSPFIFHLAKETGSLHYKKRTPISLLLLTVALDNTKMLKLVMIMYLLCQQNGSYSNFYLVMSYLSFAIKYVT